MKLALKLICITKEDLDFLLIECFSLVCLCVAVPVKAGSGSKSVSLLHAPLFLFPHVFLS